MSNKREQEYNGYANFETWLVKLWIDNEQASQKYWLERAAILVHRYDTNEDEAKYELVQCLREDFDDNNPLADNASFWTDLLNASLLRVDWREIAEALIEDAKELAE